MQMLTLQRLHLYLRRIFAPALIFFALTGSWQLFRLNDSAKDGSYVAPRLVQVLSAIHRNSHLPGKNAAAFTPLRTFSLLAAAGLVVTTVLGVVRAFRFSRNALPPLLCLLAGIVVPVLLLVVYR